tara:strand:- start:7691 stop:8977 length:1287 start_codon:yes stop_codon:yes gene_type:complete
MYRKGFNYIDFVNRVEKILELIESKPNNFKHIFTELFDKDFKSQLTFIEKLNNGSLKGLIISIKDLFDVKGYKTRGGSIFLDPLPSTKDADCISLLRNAGALLLGHTNMTELAYSGLGINPHYGTPENPIYKGSVPGGSTSGGAVSVALDISDVTIGTDTGGSTRIPAAFTGITGFKPTQDTISREGSLSLSNSLDSVGIMGKNITLCKLVYDVMINKPKSNNINVLNKNFTMIIPSNFGFDKVEKDIQISFDLAKQKIIDSGINVIEKNLPILDSYKNIPLWQFAAVECQTEYFDAYKEKSKLIDPNIFKRMDRANEVRAVEYKLLLKVRQEMIKVFNLQLENNFLLLPTVTAKPPLLKKCEDPEYYDEANLISLKNTTLANFMNGCSISLPFSHNKTTMGIMLNAATNMDHNLLEIGSIVETILKS